MADNVNWDICFLCQGSASLFTLVHQIFLLLFLTCIGTEKHFDTSPTVLTNNSIISTSLFKFSSVKHVRHYLSSLL